jgi:hypothetical protein
MRGIKVGFRDGTQHNSVVDASLPGRTTLCTRSLEEKEICHKGHLEQGRDMRFHSIMSLGLGD